MIALAENGIGMIALSLLTLRSLLLHMIDRIRALLGRSDRVQAMSDEKESVLDSSAIRWSKIPHVEESLYLPLEDLSTRERAAEYRGEITESVRDSHCWSTCRQPSPYEETRQTLSRQESIETTPSMKADRTRAPRGDWIEAHNA